MTELWQRSATDLQRLLAGGQVSAREVLEAHVARIHEVNPTVNAIVTLSLERAFDDAARADEAQAAGEPLGLLHGLPIAHKDLAETAGIRTTMGSPVFADHVPERDELLIQRLRAAGCVTVGKTNTPEFGAGSHTYNPVFGATGNPHDPSRSAGGSSGGAAAALASGMVPLADGSDLGGSLRNPASFCGIIGLRPTPGTVPSWPSGDPWDPLPTEGPMGRTAADVALFLEAMVGPHPEVPFRGAVGPFGPLDRSLAGLRVAWSPDAGGLAVERAVRDALAVELHEALALQDEVNLSHGLVVVDPRIGGDVGDVQGGDRVVGRREGATGEAARARHRRDRVEIGDQVVFPGVRRHGRVGRRGARPGLVQHRHEAAPRPAASRIPSALRASSRPS